LGINGFYVSRGVRSSRDDRPTWQIERAAQRARRSSVGDPPRNVEHAAHDVIEIRSLTASSAHGSHSARRIRRRAAKSFAPARA